MALTGARRGARRVRRTVHGTARRRSVGRLRASRRRARGAATLEAPSPRRLTPPPGLKYAGPPMGAIVVVTTVGTEQQANLIAREIIARRHGACVNILHGMRSIYRWKGKICSDGEYMLVIKTMASEYEAVADLIQELHSYELPEILTFDVTRGDPGFLEWIENSLDKTAEFSDDEDDELEAYDDD